VNPPAPTTATEAFLNARPGGVVDWSAAPPTYKSYPSSGRTVLPWHGAPTDLLGSLLRNLMGLRTRWAYAMTRQGTMPPHRPVITIGRPVPSGGALYPVEVYVGTGATPGRAAGLYHYDAAHHSIDLVRPGDHRAALTARLDGASDALPEVVIALTAVFWRNGFKYRDFAYNLHCQESGALAAQLLAIAEAHERAARVHLTFDDHALTGLLGIDPAAEGALAVLTIGSDTTTPVPDLPTDAELTATPAVQPLDPASAVTTSLPHLTRLHAAATRPVQLPRRLPAARAPSAALPEPRPVRLADGIPGRTSELLGYARDPVDLDALAAVLRCAAAGYPGDLPGPVATDLYVIVDRVRGLEPAAYRYDATSHALSQVGGGTAMAAVRGGPVHENTALGLAGAAAAVIPVGDPLAGTGRSDRWYRILQIETGLVVHRATLAAAACGLGSRIHSDGANYTTDAVLGLRERPERSLSFLLLGHRRLGATVPGPLAHSTELP
jgi:SagB-type dehydrogenase family enzyme